MIKHVVVEPHNGSVCKTDASTTERRAGGKRLHQARVYETRRLSPGSRSTPLRRPTAAHPRHPPTIQKKKKNEETHTSHPLRQGRLSSRQNADMVYSFCIFRPTETKKKRYFVDKPCDRLRRAQKTLLPRIDIRENVRSTQGYLPPTSGLGREKGFTVYGGIG